MNNLNNPLFSLTIGEYEDLHNRLIARYFSRQKNEPSEKQGHEEKSDIIFIDEAIKLTGYTKKTLYSKISRLHVPVLSRYRPLTFSRTALEEWIKAGKPNIIDVEAELHMKKIGM